MQKKKKKIKLEIFFYFNFFFFQTTPKLHIFNPTKIEEDLQTSAENFLMKTVEIDVLKSIVKKKKKN